MKLHIHGVHVPNRKNTAELAALRLPIPETVEIPMSMHIGAPAIPVVKPGDSVRVGQLIGKAGGFVSAPVYASVSGTVKKIGQQVGSGGRLMQTVVIAADGKQEPDPDLKPPKLDTMQDFLDAVRESGMVGLGGAGFPTGVKWESGYNARDGQKYMVCNADEGDPGQGRDHQRRGVRAVYHLGHAHDARPVGGADGRRASRAALFAGTPRDLRH